MKPHRRKIRREPARDVTPPEVPEVVSATSAPAEPEVDPIPEHIRKMLEAAYT
jgi:hypothetical protein